jgi:hypothetical protein
MEICNRARNVCIVIFDVFVLFSELAGCQTTYEKNLNEYLLQHRRYIILKLKYRTDGRRRLGRPLKRPSDEAETGTLKPNL